MSRSPGSNSKVRWRSLFSNSVGRTVSLVPRLSINAGAENRLYFTWYQTYAHALDIAAIIPSVTVKSMTNDVFTGDDLLGRPDFSLGGITPAPQTGPVPQTTIVQASVSDVALATYTGQVS